MSRTKMHRMWVNQPSNLQPLHSLHGTRVIAIKVNGNQAEIMFLSGEVISQLIDWNALSTGWPPHSLVTQKEVSLFCNAITDDDCCYRGEGAVASALSTFMNNRN